MKLLRALAVFGLVLAVAGVRVDPAVARRRHVTKDPACGSSLKGVVKFTHDVTCPSLQGFQVTKDGTAVSLGGFTISGAGGVGIDIPPGIDGVVLKNGSITGYLTGIRIVDANKTHVTDVDVSGNSGGLTASGDNTRLLRVIADDSLVASGIDVEGDGTQIDDSEASDNPADGINAPGATGSGNTADGNGGTNCNPVSLCGGNAGAPAEDADGDHSNRFEDCDDNDAAVYPGATETFNGIDDDCDGATDEGFTDADTDGDPSGTDCDDNDPARHHGATETFNGKDDDCDGSVDEGFTPEPLLISEASPVTTAEFVEVYNPNPVSQVLDNVWVSDSENYWGVPCGINAPAAGDFRVHFPTGAVIAAGGHVVVSLSSSATFFTAFSKYPDYTLTAGDVNATPMIGEINGTPALTNGGEPVVLFSWDAVSTIVRDEDYLFYGSATVTNPLVNKTGQACPSGTTYTTDQASLVPIAAPASTKSVQRTDNSEGTETKSGGNGLTGHDETTENVATTFSGANAPTPGT